MNLRRAPWIAVLTLAMLVRGGICQTAVPYEADIQEFEAQDAKYPPAKGGIVFVGSSSIGLWKTLAQDFPRHNVIRRGFGGSQLTDSIRFVHRIVTPYQPRMVVLFAGTNDVASGKTGETVFNDFRTFVGEVRSKLPDARIAYISLTPAPVRWQFKPQIVRANTLIRDFCLQGENLVFVDVYHAMLDAEGNPRPELFLADRLHMNVQGYAIWRKTIAPLLPWGN